MLRIPFVIFIVIGFCFYKCKTKSNENTDAFTEYLKGYESLPGDSAGIIIKLAIQKAGGWQNWTSKSALKFIKSTSHFDSTGSLTRKTKQLNEYNLFPAFKARISWEENGIKHVILNNGSRVWQLDNDELVTDEKITTSAWNSSFGSHYVMSMPFKLAEQGITLSYQGHISLPNGKIAKSVKVKYKDGMGTSAKFHTWWYYFDPVTYELTANFLDHGQGYTYTQYETFFDAQGIHLNQSRKSFQSDSSRSTMKYTTLYENENIEFVKSFPDFYFDYKK